MDVSRTIIPIHDLPPTLKKLTYKFYPKQRLMGLRGRLANLRELDLSGSRELKRIDDLPYGLLVLNVAETGMTSLPPLPPLLRELDISNTKIKSLSGLHEGLVKLIVHAGQLEALDDLPASVQDLSFVDKDED